MKFIYEDLLNFLTEKPSKKALSEKLFQLGHEHEIYGDIFDMEITPNRGDCLSLRGLSRDLNNFYNFIDPYQIYEEDIDQLDLNFKNESVESCPKISFLEIEIDENISPYKPYLENYFLNLGNNKINFFTDISNYISYEMGQPTHCFDSELITNQLVFSNRDCNDSFKTLLGNEVKLEGKNCVFTIDGEIVSLAGVMGGESTACSAKTKKVLVECAYFNPEDIIGKTVKYNLKSEAAHKFERGVDIFIQEEVLRRFITVVQDHTTIKSLKIKTFDSNNFQEKYLPIDVEGVNKILGTKLKKEEYINYLEGLGFEIKENIKIPSFRNDIASQNDLSEEIARIIGYDNIESIPIKSDHTLKKEQNKISIIEDFFVMNGFSEVINFPFTDIEEEKSILIDNPLDSNKNNLRTSLKKSLIENLIFNERRQKDSIKLFEISDVYLKEMDITQEKKLGIIISGRRGHNYSDFTKKLDNTYINEILNLKNNTFIFDFEEVSREGLKTKRKEKIFFAELLVKDIPDEFFHGIESRKANINFIKYHQVSEFPSSTRDFSFSIGQIDQYNNFISLIKDFQDDILKDFFIFDFYKNDKLGEIKVGIRLIFQSRTKTLSDDDIQKSVDKILQPVINLNGVSVPGLELK